MTSIDSMVRSNILAWPSLFASRGDVLHHILCVLGSGYKWVNGEAVSVTEENGEVWDAETERARQRADYPDNPVVLETLEPRWEAWIAEAQHVVDTVDERIHDMAVNRGFYPQTKYALIMEVPADITPEWAEAVEQMKAAAKENGWTF